MSNSAEVAVAGSSTDSRAKSALVGAPLLPMMMRLAMPGVIGAMLQTLLVIMEIWYLSRAGTTALAAVATVFPLVMLANMLSAGAIGGATSGAVARAMGAGDLLKAQSILRSAILIAVTGGVLMGVFVLSVGPTFFHWLGARDDVLAAATRYAGIVFAGVPLLWLFDMLGSVLRGAGDMTRAATAMASVVLSFASQGMNTLAWPVLGAVLRTLVVASGLVWVSTDALTTPQELLWLLASAMWFYGVFVVAALRLGAWRIGPWARFLCAVKMQATSPDRAFLLGAGRYSATPQTGSVD